MASLSDVRVKRKITSKLYIYVWLKMSGHGSNPILFNNNKKKKKLKKKDWMSKTLANSPPPYVR